MQRNEDKYKVKSCVRNNTNKNTVANISKLVGG